MLLRPEITLVIWGASRCYWCFWFFFPFRVVFLRWHDADRSIAGREAEHLVSYSAIYRRSIAPACKLRSHGLQNRILYVQQAGHHFNHQLELNVIPNRKPWALHQIFRHYWNPQKTSSAFPPCSLRPYFSASVVPVLHLFSSSGPPSPGNTELLGDFI